MPERTLRLLHLVSFPDCKLRSTIREGSLFRSESASRNTGSFVCSDDRREFVIVENSRLCTEGEFARGWTSLLLLLLLLLLACSGRCDRRNRR